MMTTKEAEQIALDAWREDEAWRLVYKGAPAYPELAQHEEYRRLVRDDVHPPVAVDRAEVIYQQAYTQETVAEGVTLIRTYGDERFAEGERAGIERVRFYFLNHGWVDSAEMCVQFLGEQQ